jgi:enamine deaminase RidA (YjgF/YER057c/UK114 family)
VLAYSRAVAIEGHVSVSGTLPVDESGALVGGSDAYLRARHVFTVALSALAEAGAAPENVVRIRIYLQEYADFEAIARAQFEFFEHVRPACTVTQAGLVKPEYRVQVDADAIV